MKSSPSHQRRMLVVSLDGFPRSLFEEWRGKGLFRQIDTVMNGVRTSAMDSVLPTVSSVAWSTYMSGRNPGGHNIYGFVDRALPSMSLTLPNALDRKGPTLWHVLGQYDIPVIVMNVPVTYPPERVNGILVGGFLGVDVAKIASPPAISTLLTQRGYIIDADTTDAQTEPAAFIAQLEAIIRQRCAIFRELLSNNTWQFAHLHIMETDRLFHFLWPSVVNPDDALHGNVLRLIDTLDQCVSEVIASVDDEDEICILSDHGFCASEIEWDINAWLVDKGLLQWCSDAGKGLARMAPKSTAYSLLPGRIYLNLKGREPHGSITPAESRPRIAEVIAALRAERQPDETHPVFRDVLPGLDLFSGPYSFRAPDIIAVPSDGVELKSRTQVSPIVSPPRLKGMHTRDNALVTFRHGRRRSENPGIIDLYPTILNFFGICDRNAEGNVFAAWPSHDEPANFYEFRYEKGETPCQN